MLPARSLGRFWCNSGFSRYNAETQAKMPVPEGQLSFGQLSPKEVFCLRVYLENGGRF